MNTDTAGAKEAFIPLCDNRSELLLLLRRFRIDICSMNVLPMRIGSWKEIVHKGIPVPFRKVSAPVTVCWLRKR